MSELSLAKQNEAYHRKQMEYFQEQIKIIKGEECFDSPQENLKENSNKNNLPVKLQPVNTNSKVKNQHKAIGEDANKGIDNLNKKYKKEKRK